YQQRRGKLAILRATDLAPRASFDVWNQGGEVLSPARDRIAILTDRWSGLVDARTGARLRPFLPRPKQSFWYTVSWSDDGAGVLAADPEKMATVWDATTGRQVGTTLDLSQSIRLMRLSPDGRRVVTVFQEADATTTMQIWSVDDGHRLPGIPDVNEA